MTTLTHDETGSRIRRYVDQQEGMCWCGFDADDHTTESIIPDHIIHSLADDGLTLTAEGVSR